MFLFLSLIFCIIFSSPNAFRSIFSFSFVCFSTALVLLLIVFEFVRRYSVYTIFSSIAMYHNVYFSSFRTQINCLLFIIYFIHYLIDLLFVHFNDYIKLLQCNGERNKKKMEQTVCSKNQWKIILFWRFSICYSIIIINVCQ